MSHLNILGLSGTATRYWGVGAVFLWHGISRSGDAAGEKAVPSVFQMFS